MTKKKTKKRIPAVVSPRATIELKVTRFHGLKDFSDPARFCEIDDPNIPAGQDAGGLVYILSGAPRTIRVDRNPTGAPIELEFVVLPKKDYIAAGVVINRGGLDDPGVDQENFKLGKIKKNKLILNDNYTVGLSSWELMVAIQKISSGDLGLIDPGVENSEA